MKDIISPRGTLFSIAPELKYLIFKDVIRVVHPLLALEIAYGSKHKLLIQAVHLRIASFRIGTKHPGTIEDERAFMVFLRQFLHVDAFSKLVIINGQLAVSSKATSDSKMLRNIKHSIDILIARIKSRSFENLPIVSDILAQEATVLRLKNIRKNLIQLYRNLSPQIEIKFSKLNLFPGRVLLVKVNNVLITASFVDYMSILHFSYLNERMELIICNRVVSFPEDGYLYLRRVATRVLMELFAKMKDSYAFNFPPCWAPHLYNAGILQSLNQNHAIFDLNHPKNRERCEEFLDKPILNIIDSSIYDYFQRLHPPLRC